MNRSDWLKGRHKEFDRSMRAQLRYLGRRHYNPDRLINSAFGDKILETNGFWYFTDFTEDAPETHAYWESVGIKKEIHHIDDYEAKWSAHLPLEIFKEENKGKKYPVIILLHGAGGRGNDLEVTRQNPFFVIILL